MAAVYLVWYMYSPEIMGLVPTLANSMKNNIDKMLKTSKHVEHIMVNEISGKVATSCQSNGKQCYVEGGETNYLGIITYYINVSSLIKVNVVLDKYIPVPLIWDRIEYYFTAFINLDIFAFSYDVCPFSGMTIQSKALIKTIIVFFILLIWLALSILIFFVSKIKRFKNSRYLNTFKYRLVCGLIETMKFTYSLKAGTVFFLITCIDVGTKHLWLYDAEIVCYTWWQKLLIAYLTNDVVPFSLTIMTGLVLLKRGFISPINFIFACFLPLPFLVSWGFLYFLKWRKQHVSPFIQLNKVSETILDSFQGAYRDHSFLTSCWEGVVEFRKLLFNLVTLISNNVFRLILGCTMCIIALVHHICYAPFKGMKDNWTETISLCLLTVCAACSTAKAVLSDFGITPQSGQFNEKLFQVLELWDHLSLAILVISIIWLEVFHNGKKKKTAKIK